DVVLGSSIGVRPVDDTAPVVGDGDARERHVLGLEGESDAGSVDALTHRGTDDPDRPLERHPSQAYSHGERTGDEEQDDQDDDDVSARLSFGRPHAPLPRRRCRIAVTTAIPNTRPASAAGNRCGSGVRYHADRRATSASGRKLARIADVSAVSRETPVVRASHRRAFGSPSGAVTQGSKATTVA